MGRVGQDKRRAFKLRDMSDNTFMTRILQETGCDKTVKEVSLTDDMWVVIYSDPSLNPDKFAFFDDLYEFLKYG